MTGISRSGLKVRIIAANLKKSRLLFPSQHEHPAIDASRTYERVCGQRKQRRREDERHLPTISSLTGYLASYLFLIRIIVRSLHLVSDQAAPHLFDLKTSLPPEAEKVYRNNPPIVGAGQGGIPSNPLFH